MLRRLAILVAVAKLGLVLLVCMGWLWCCWVCAGVEEEVASQQEQLRANSKAGACWTSCRLPQKHVWVVKHQRNSLEPSALPVPTQLQGLARTRRVLPGYLGQG